MDQEKDKLVITKGNLTHNHEASSEIFPHYPEQRRATNEQKDHIRTLSKLCVTPATICRHLNELHGKRLTVMDIRNIRREKDVKRDLEGITGVLQEFLSEDGNKVVAFKANIDGEIQGIQWKSNIDNFCLNFLR